MARQTKRGICELCGAHTNVGTNHGSKACLACTHVQTALNKRPEAVAKAIRAMHKTEEMLGYLIPAGGGIAVKMTADFLQEISGLVGYDGEDPGELVAAVRKATAPGAHQLTSEAEAGALRTIAGIVGYDGTDGSEVVAAVRKQVLTCASCDSEDILAEIREIVGYSPNMGDSGLADAVRALIVTPGTSPDCADCTTLRGDLLRACGMEMDDTEDGEGWDVAAAAAIQTIANAEWSASYWEDQYIDGGSRDEIVGERDDLRRELIMARQTNRAKLTLAERSRDEWEIRAVQAERNVETMEAEFASKEDEAKEFMRWANGKIGEMRVPDQLLFDLASIAVSAGGNVAHMALEKLIDAARRAV